jgi:hypothetical protein
VASQRKCIRGGLPGERRRVVRHRRDYRCERWLVALFVSRFAVAVNWIERFAARQQSSARHEAQFQADAIRVFEQHRIVTRCSATLFRLAYDLRAYIPQHNREPIHVFTRAGT